jgi:valyl-tRNA synthetase
MGRFGTDAFRFTLATISVPGVRDVRISDDRVESYRNFANKLWNASRFVLSNLDGYDAKRGAKAPKSLADRWVVSRFDATVREVRDSLRRYRFHDAAGALYEFIWRELCDWYLEMAKQPLYKPATPDERLAAQHTLVTTLEATLRLLHPFMPFITEELWQRLPGAGESIMLAAYPKPRRKASDPAAERAMTALVDLVTAIRTIRGEMRIGPGVTLAVTVKPAGDHGTLFAEHQRLIDGLARTQLTLDANATRPAGSALAVVGPSEAYVDLARGIDVAPARTRLEKDIRKATETIAFLEGKLGRPDFVEKAPAEVVERERSRLTTERETRDKLTASLTWISG